MARSKISFFVDDVASVSVQARVPNAVVNSGVFGGSSNSPGIGISTENPFLGESLPNWTLLDQFGNVRQNQRGQLIGGNGVVPREGDVPTTWDASQPSYSPAGAASSGGVDGTQPDATIRVVDEDDLPTAAEKEADSNVDGSLSFPLFGAELVDLDTGWAESGI